MKLTGQQLYELTDGTAVRVIYDSSNKYDSGDIIYRLKDFGDCNQSSNFRNDNGKEGFMVADEVELIVAEAPRAVAGEGIARPVLEERKIGKIAIELFDGGFPNAIMAVAEVMTWAAEHKGYKPHDWKNLPNPEVAFDAAGSRHRVKHNIQRAAGLSICSCVDEESELLHKAHEAFNVLAQLELMITGKIQ
jgi:hypothetical protein